LRPPGFTVAAGCLVLEGIMSKEAYEKIRAGLEEAYVLLASRQEPLGSEFEQAYEDAALRMYSNLNEDSTD
jgi:hypothetical protein